MPVWGLIYRNGNSSLRAKAHDWLSRQLQPCDAPCHHMYRFPRIYEQGDEKNFQVFLDREEQEEKKEKRRYILVFLGYWKQAAPYGDMAALIGHHLGGYLLEEEIGQGAMGIVYRGRQVTLERDVAVKVFSHPLAPDPSFGIRFVREARILAELNHPHIVQIYDAGQQEEVLYFVMEYVQGPTLRNLLRLDGKMPAPLAIAYIAQAADALHAAWTEHHLIHRDLKPENLMLDRWGRLKVMDFGLARVPGLLEITEAHTLVGSLSYASPEQLLGLPLDHRSDVYTLGVVLYELLTGRLPFAGETFQEVTQAILTGQVVSPRAHLADVPSELEQLLWSAMASNRDERFAHAGLMANALCALPFAGGHSEPPRTPLETIFPVKEPSTDTTYCVPGNPPEPHPYTPIIASRFTLPMRPPSMGSSERQPSQDRRATEPSWDKEDTTGEAFHFTVF